MPSPSNERELYVTGLPRLRLPRSHAVLAVKLHTHIEEFNLEAYSIVLAFVMCCP